MNKKTQSIFSLVVGCISALVALFYLISGILDLTHIGDVAGSATAVIYLILIVLVALCAAAGLCFCGVKLILGFSKKNDDPSYIKLAAVVFFSYHALTNLILLFFNLDIIEYFGVEFWLKLVVVIIGLVLALVAVLNKKFDAKTSAIFNIVVQGYGFVAAIVVLALGAAGLELAALIFNMLAFAVAVTYFIFEIIISNNGGAKETKAVEAEDTKEVEEPKAEDAAE